MEWLTDPHIWVGFLTLTALEVVLGIDNLVFISILAGKLPESQRFKARTIGLALALIMRILMLLAIGWLVGLTAPLFTLFGVDFSGQSIILLAGGLFLVGKATHEIHEKLEGDEGQAIRRAGASMISVVLQITIIDMVFSVDSVITAVGMVDEVPVMIAAVVVSIGFMIAFAGTLSDFVERHPTVKMLALAFLVLIGVNLIAEAFGQHIPKGYTYFAMGFSVLVEALNMRLKRVSQPVSLHGPMKDKP